MLLVTIIFFTIITCLKNAWLLISSPPFSKQPSLFDGFFTRNWTSSIYFFCSFLIYLQLCIFFTPNWVFITRSDSKDNIDTDTNDHIDNTYTNPFTDVLCLFANGLGVGNLNKKKTCWNFIDLQNIKKIRKPVWNILNWIKNPMKR